MIDYKTPEQEMTSWQQVAYQMDDITLVAIFSLQRLFKNKAEEHKIVANVCNELANLSTMLKGPALKLMLQNTLSSLN